MLSQKIRRNSGILCIVAVIFCTFNDLQAGKTKLKEMPSYLEGYEELWEKDPKAANLAWFKNADLGLFIHFSPASVVGSGKWAKADHWFTLHGKRNSMDYEEYDKYLNDIFDSSRYTPEAKQIINSFKPDKFDADAIAKLASECGMKYITFTSNHVMGKTFNFDTKTSDLATTKLPAQRDFVAELSQACEKYKLGLCLYVMPPYSRPVIYPRLKEMYTELLTNYGPIATMWFDGIGAAKARRKDFSRTSEVYALVRELQPHCLISFKQGFNGEEDFLAPEGGKLFKFPIDEDNNLVPYDLHDTERAAKWKGKHVQVCIPMSAGWFFSPPKNGKELRHRSVEDLMKEYKYIHEHNGSLLLNVPPCGDGSYHPKFIEFMRDFAKQVEEYEQSRQLK